jgi:histidine ammonia-lyase
VGLRGERKILEPIVHQEKNHRGECLFAKTIKELGETRQQVSKSGKTRVQDPYSIRCGPQVHGVAYDCLIEHNNGLPSLINKPHFKFLTLNGKNLANLLMESDTFSLKMDYLVCSLQEIGAMAFMRL